MSLDLAAVHRIMSPKQIRSIVEATARINIWHGAVSSGKTVASLMAFLGAVAAAPPQGLIYIVARTLQTAERNCIDVLMEPFGPFGPIAQYVHHTRGSSTAIILGRLVHIVGASDVRAEGRIRGSTAAVIYIDEGSLTPESFFVMCLSRARIPGARIFVTTNPDSPNHWLRRNFLLREAQLNLRQWAFSLADNPSLTPEYIASLLAEYTGLFRRRFVNGEWCLAEGAVFDSFDPDVHVVDKLPPIVRWVGLGIDYGSVNPFAAELLGLGADGVLYLAAEWYYDSKIAYRQMTDDEYSKAVRDWLDGMPIPGTTVTGVRPEWTAVDPSATSFRLRLHADGVTSVLGDNAVLPGIRMMASLLATGRLKIHRSCKALIAEMPGYSWDPRAAEKGQDSPIKVGDHCIDGSRYIIKTTESVWRHRIRAAAHDKETQDYAGVR